VEGFSLAAFKARFGIAFEDAYPASCKRLVEKGWLTLADGRAYLTAKGLLMQNAALLEFMD